MITAKYPKLYRADAPERKVVETISRLRACLLLACTALGATVAALVTLVVRHT